MNQQADAYTAEADATSPPQGVVCTYCGHTLDPEEAASPRRDETDAVMCDDCYSEHYEYLCPLCLNLVEIEGNQEHILITPALAEDQAMPPGIYRITALPWFTSNYFSMTIHQHAVKRESALPNTADGMHSGHYICDPCAQSANRKELGVAPVRG